MTRPYSKDPTVERSLQHSVRDGVSYSVMSGAGEIYLSAYALFLKASTAQIAWLAALPPLLGSFAQLLSAWFGNRTRQRKRIILTGVILQALTWLPIIWLPYFFPTQAVPILVGCAVLYYASGNLATPVWNSLMGDLVPERKRGCYFAQRTALMSLASLTALVSAGVTLHYFEVRHSTWLGFAIVFSLAALARLYSAYYISLMVEPPHPACAAQPPSPVGLLRRLRQSNFARFSIFFAFMNFAVYIASPFFAVYMLRDLGFTYLQFMGSTATVVIAQFLILNVWGRIGDRFGNRLILVITGVSISILPLLWLASTHYWYILLIQLLSGLCWAGFSLSASNFVYDTVAPGKRAMYVAVNSVLSSAGLFLGALLGGFLSLHVSDQLSLFGHSLVWPSNLCWIFLISALVRVAMAAIFLPRLREVRSVRPLSSSGLLFRVAQFGTLNLVFSTFTLGRRNYRRKRMGVTLKVSRKTPLSTVTPAAAPGLTLSVAKGLERPDSSQSLS